MEPNPDYTDAVEASEFCYFNAPFSFKTCGLGGTLYPIPAPPPKPSPFDMVKPATPSEVERYAGQKTPTAKPAGHPRRLKFKRVYKAAGYPIDPRAEKARALDGHALTAPRTYDFAASRLKMLDELN